MKNIDILSAAGYIAAGGGGIIVSLSAAWPNQAVKITAVGSIVIFLASILVRLYNNKTDAPATSIIANAPVVPQGTTVTTDQTLTLGTNTHE